MQYSVLWESIQTQLLQRSIGLEFPPQKEKPLMVWCQWSKQFSTPQLFLQFSKFGREWKINLQQWMELRGEKSGVKYQTEILRETTFKFQMISVRD